MTNGSTIRRADYPNTPTKDREKGQLESLAEKAGDQLGTIAGQAEQVAHRVLEQGKEAGQGVQEVAGNIRSAVDRSIKDQPLATLAITAMVGFVLGALWKS
ncbi:MAG: hypothetical protein U1E56_08955 [Bauldia sp.]